MNVNDLLHSLEGPEFEAKAAQGGLPEDFWETYSAFANTAGGTIVLGLREEGERFIPVGLNSPARMRKSLFDNLNNRKKVNVNILRDSNVTEQEADGKRLLVVYVPPASRSLKPVYINGDPVRGTFRRVGDADYRCTEEVMRRMWAETVDARDRKILPGFDLNDLDRDSLTAYRNLFRGAAPDHVFQIQDDLEFLTNLGGWRTDRESGETGLTLAGLLMFGRERPLLDALPHFQVDYRETEAGDTDVRWNYRHTVDGRWSPNLFEFYRRTIARLTRDLAIPFRLQNLQRIDDSHVAEALREAAVNALIHADHEASGGIVVVRQPYLFIFENPGDLRVPRDQALQGGVSDCRNPSLQRMFRLVGLGEQVGSGIPRMRRAWEEQTWRAPDLWDDPEIYRTMLLLPTVSLLPEASLQALRGLYGEGWFSRLSQDAVLAAVTAHVEGQVSRGRLAAMTDLHPVDVANLLRDMATKGLLEQIRPRRGLYRLPKEAAPSYPHSDVSSPHSGASSPHSVESSPHSSMLSTPSGSDTSATGETKDESWEALLHIADPARRQQWLQRSEMRSIVLRLCSMRALRLAELAELMNRKPKSLRQNYLVPLLEGGEIRYLYPGEPTHPLQAYVAIQRELPAAMEQETPDDG